MVRELIVTCLPAETRMALLEDGEVVELGVEPRLEQSILHGVYRGRVQRVIPGTQSAFVDLGLVRNGFLQVGHVPRGNGSETGDPAGNGRIEDMLRVGQAILVQVTREPLGPKGYKVSGLLRLPGRYFDFRPFSPNDVVVSPNIEGEREQVRLKALMRRVATLPGEWSARASSEQRDEEALRADILRLEADFAEIRRQAASGPPACLRAEVPMVFRYVRDVLFSGFSVIRVDSEDLYGRLLNFIRQFLPGMEHNVRLYSRNYPIFDEYGVEAAFANATRRRVRLPSGGSIVIDQTEALVAVDVNTGSFQGDGSDREDTNTATNLEAAAEVARQLRLRDLGGIIVVDFIDMKESRNRDRVFRALQERLRRDPAFTRASPPEPRAGLVIITRKRERASLDFALLAPCPECKGSGRVRSLHAVCQDIVNKARRDFASGSDDLLIRAVPTVAAALGASPVLQEIRSAVGGEVVIKESLDITEGPYVLERSRSGTAPPGAGETLVTAPSAVGGEGVPEQVGGEPD